MCDHPVTGVMFSESELANRRPVWIAMADLFLDTEITDTTTSYIVGVCAASPYSLQALRTILFYEVMPTCIINLHSVAGEWAGFNEDWVENRITQRLRSPRKHAASIFFWRHLPMFGWRYFEKELRHRWKQIDQLIRDTRTKY